LANSCKSHVLDIVQLVDDPLPRATTPDVSIYAFENRAWWRQARISSSSKKSRRYLLPLSLTTAQSPFWRINVQYEINTNPQYTPWLVSQGADVEPSVRANLSVRT